MSQAETFADLHKGPDVLVLPNAWDAASAAMLEDAGAKAVATSSAAVAWAHGYADGDLLPQPALIATISEAARVVKVPLTADIEGGYTDDLSELAEVIKAVIGAGAVGINLEDGARDPDLHARKVEAARKAAAAAGVELFINARIDVFIRGGSGLEALAETLRRAELYKDAGASGIFVPWVAEDEVIGALAKEIALPLNVLGRPGLSSLEILKGLGVRRLSSGTAPFVAAYATLQRAATDFIRTGDAPALSALGAGMPNLNKRFG